MRREPQLLLRLRVLKSENTWGVVGWISINRLCGNKGWWGLEGSERVASVQTNCVAQRVPCPKQGLNLPGKEQWTAGVEAEGKSSSPTSAQFLGCEELNPEMSKRKCCLSALTCRKRGHSGVGAQPGQSLRSAQAKLRPGPRDACSPRPLPNPRLRKRLASFYEISRTKLYVNIH